MPAGMNSVQMAESWPAAFEGTALETLVGSIVVAVAAQSIPDPAYHARAGWCQKNVPQTKHAQTTGAVPWIVVAGIVAEKNSHCELAPEDLESLGHNSDQCCCNFHFAAELYQVYQRHWAACHEKQSAPSFDLRSAGQYALST